VPTRRCGAAGARGTRSSSTASTDLDVGSRRLSRRPVVGTHGAGKTCSDLQRIAGSSPAPAGSVDVLGIGPVRAPTPAIRARRIASWSEEPRAPVRHATRWPTCSSSGCRGCRACPRPSATTMVVADAATLIDLATSHHRERNRHPFLLSGGQKAAALVRGAPRSWPVRRCSRSTSPLVRSRTCARSPRSCSTSLRTLKRRGHLPARS
jgi:hypothetical protein